jgi:uroporphyrinogen-III synthase
MIEKSIRILSTRPLEVSLLERAAQAGIIIEALSFISTEPDLSGETDRRIIEVSHDPMVVVFTSMNAVEAVLNHLRQHRPPWKIFCLGSTTRRLVADHFGEEAIAGIAGSAGELADSIIGEGGVKKDIRGRKDIGEVIFFCGDQRRDELPDKLSKAGIDVREIVVYRTVQTPRLVEGVYEGIAFFSPSAVKSFFSVNSVPARAILFAIGHTTAEAIRDCCANPVVISGSPEKGTLIGDAIRYFKSKNIQH